MNEKADINLFGDQEYKSGSTLINLFTSICYIITIDIAQCRKSNGENVGEKLLFLVVLQCKKPPSECNSHAASRYGKMHFATYERNISCGARTISFHVTRKKAFSNSFISYRHF